MDMSITLTNESTLVKVKQSLQYFLRLVYSHYYTNARKKGFLRICLKAGFHMIADRRSQIAGRNKVCDRLRSCDRDRRR